VITRPAPIAKNPFKQNKIITKNKKQLLPSQPAEFRIEVGRADPKKLQANATKAALACCSPQNKA
jgi:hypothetical protein